jgi:hypothetical protein
MSAAMFAGSSYEKIIRQFPVTVRLHDPFRSLAQLVGHRGRHSLGASVLVQLLQPFVAKADKFACHPASYCFLSMYGSTVHVKRISEKG